MNKGMDTKIRHYFNESINALLKEMRVKISPDLEYDYGLELDYEKLLDDYKMHISKVIFANGLCKKKRCRK